MNQAAGQRRHRAASVALAGLLVGILSTGNALAQLPLRLTPSITLNANKPKLAVLVVGLDQAAFAQTARLAYFAEQAALRTDRFDVVKLTEALDPENARARQSRLEEAEETMKLGQKSYDDLDTQKALQHYEKAVKLYEQTDLTKNFQGLVQAWLMKVASMIANGENKAAEAELDRIIPLDPRATLSSNYFTPDSITYAEKVKKNANSNANNTIEVKTAPVNAQVYVDGRFQGIAPLKVAGLTPAEHYVTVIAPGFSLGQQRARSGAVDFDLRKADGYPRYQAAADKVKLDPEGPQRDQAAQEFGRFLGVDQVLLTVLKKSTAGEKVEVTALRVEVKDGHNHSYKTGTLNLDDALAQSSDTFYTSLSTADDPRKGGPVTHFKGGGGGSKTVGYALLGGGAALILGGLYFGISASNQSAQFRTLPQLHPAAASTASTGRTYALLADVFVIAGLASAGAGSYFAFVKKGGGGEGTVEPTPEKKPSKRKAAEDDLREADAKQKSEEEKRKRAESEAREAEQRALLAEEEKRKADEEAKRIEEEAARSKKGKKLSKKEQAEEAKRLEEEKKRADEAAAKAEDERRKAEEEAARKKAEAEALKKAEEEAARKKKEAEEKRKKAEEDDLRNY